MPKFQIGPSPRTWGERRKRILTGWQFRTIPTHVGRTPRHSTARPGPTDHPHARGENDAALAGAGNGAGPSPRTWGERLSVANLRS